MKLGYYFGLRTLLSILSVTCCKTDSWESLYGKKIFQKYLHFKKIFLFQKENSPFLMKHVVKHFSVFCNSSLGKSMR